MKKAIKKIAKAIVIIILAFFLVVALRYATNKDARQSAHENFQKGYSDAEKGIYEPPSMEKD